MVGSRSIQFFNKTNLILLGIILSSLIAFYGIIIFWPQNNPSDDVKIVIPRGATLATVGDVLVKQKILSNRKSFMMAVKTLGHETNIPAGTFRLVDATTNYSIIYQLVYGQPMLKRITLLEGWTMDKIIDELTQKLSLSREKLTALCYDPQFATIQGLPGTTLEGFLYPDTYLFTEGLSPREVLTTIIGEYKENVTDALLKDAERRGFLELEIITLASIIEGEAIYDSERPVISAVYHNRLRRGMRLQADPTIQYIIEDGPRRLFNRDLRIDSPYNTYLNNGLPPGPINNPGLESIKAAVYPAENDFLYFVARGDGYHTFSRTQKEHIRAKQKFQRIRRKVWLEQRQNRGSNGE